MHHPAAHVYSLIDSNLADETGAEGTMDWREKMYRCWKTKSKTVGHGFVSKSISDVLRFNYTVGRVSEMDRILHILIKAMCILCHIDSLYFRNSSGYLLCVMDSCNYFQKRVCSIMCKK